MPEEEDINMAEQPEEAVVQGAGDFPFSKLLSSLPKYDGNSPWNIHESALEQWRLLNAVNRATHEWQKVALLYSLKGSAAERAQTVGRGTALFTGAAGWNAMKTLLRNLFGPAADSEISRVAFRARRQSAKEDVVSYLTAKISLWRCAYPTEAQQQFDQLLDACIDGMVNKVIKRMTRRANPGNQADMIRIATNAVASERYAYSGGYSESTSLDGLTTIIESTSGRKFQATDESEPMEVDAMKETRKCFNCGLYGHIQKDCRKPKKKGEEKGQDFKKKVKCYNCNEYGHYARECMKPNKKKKAELNAIEEVEEIEYEIED